ncbi:unnamed protein product [Dibothriocephalus latus]|uniref:Uncharacterized protein n=1 Tax=Dibothriocephalus latus TaxID=60516 RepID=A0A3P7P857_DIBLA|nr:unnamed protein product [Dibothriocephalus latus]
MLAFAHEEPSSIDASCYSTTSGASSSVQANFVQQDLICKQRALESLERNCLKRTVVEERRRFTEFTTCLEPVLKYPPFPHLAHCISHPHLLSRFSSAHGNRLDNSIVGS